MAIASVVKEVEELDDEEEVGEEEEEEEETGEDGVVAFVVENSKVEEF